MRMGPGYPQKLARHPEALKRFGDGLTGESI